MPRSSRRSRASGTYTQGSMTVSPRRGLRTGRRAEREPEALRRTPRGALGDILTVRIFVEPVERVRDVMSGHEAERRQEHQDREHGPLALEVDLGGVVRDDHAAVLGRSPGTALAVVAVRSCPGRVAR